MRFKLILCTAMLPPALLLAGCGMGTMTDVTSNMDSPALSGQAFGGQSPIVGAEVEVVAMGTSSASCPTGYGCPGTVLAIAPYPTDSGGNFQFAAGAYTCPQPNTPTYLLAIGGSAGSAGNNVHIANAVGLGTCTNAESSHIIVNEVTTVALAYSLAHFFTTTIGGNNAFQADGDWFGGPSSTSGGTVTYSDGLVLGNSYTIPALVNTATGTPNASTSTVTVDSAKIYTIANILAACVNSSGSTNNGQPCQVLFKNTTIGSTAPYDTLQAAVEMALSGYSASSPGGSSGSIQNLYALQGSAPAFGGGLTGTPNDFTIALSYTSSAFALGVDNGTATTIDIDSSERVWFPSNLTGATGAGYFDQTSRTFNGPYTSTGMLHPQQVAIDQSGYAWLNDSQSFTVHGFLTTSPATTESFTLTGAFSNALTIAKDNSINVGLNYFGTTNEMATISPARTTYAVQSGTSLSYPIISVAADVSGNNGVATTNSASLQLTDYLISYPVSGNTVTPEVNSKKDGSGQVIYTGNDFIGTRPFSQSGTVSTKNDGLCIFSLGTCKNIKGGNQNAPVGIAIDGGKSLWLPESGDAGVLQVTPTGTGGKPDGGIYLNTGGGVPNNEFLHDSANGGALITPYGVAIDKEGNVWISNATCTFTGCLPTVTNPSFTLTEIVGAATPTVVPVSSQIEYGLTGSEPLH